MKSSYVKIAFLFMAGAGLALSCAQSETDDIHVGPGSGGASSTGGTTATGGNSSTGGATATGGTSTGGTTATGGTIGTGGTHATGGTTGSGGVIGTGGNPGSGGGGAGRSGSGGSTGMAGNNGTGGAGGGTATFADVTALFAANCVSCHDGTAHTDLRASGLYSRIVNQNATKSCTTQKLIVPNSPSTSLISNKIKGTNLGGCGVRMPNGCSTTSSNPRACLTTTQIATVDNWINAGAPM